jgi:Sulfotransferase domain
MKDMWMSKRVPEILIIGTMKGGTTILWDYLKTHPHVVPGQSKEVHYFSLYSSLGHSWYLDQFPDRSNDALAVDASPTYFDLATMPTIPNFIKAVCPSSKIILIVRDPVERAISHFQHLRSVSYPDMFAMVDINEFLSRPLERLFSRHDPSDEMLQYVFGFSVYDQKYYNYIRSCGRENVLVVHTDELRADARATMRRVFTHCSLDFVDSPLFGKQDYLSGSELCSVKQSVLRRLSELLYPSYKIFCEASGLEYRQKAHERVESYD